VIGFSVRKWNLSMKVERQDGRELLPLRRMAARLGVPSAWLKEQAEAGNVPGLRAGNRWLFVPCAVTDAVKALAGDPMAQLLAPERKGAEQ
jgi:hypothetical protein